MEAEGDDAAVLRVAAGGLGPPAGEAVERGQGGVDAGGGGPDPDPVDDVEHEISWGGVEVRQSRPQAAGRVSNKLVAIGGASVLPFAPPARTLRAPCAQPVRAAPQHGDRRWNTCMACAFWIWQYLQRTTRRRD